MAGGNGSGILDWLIGPDSDDQPSNTPKEARQAFSGLERHRGRRVVSAMGWEYYHKQTYGGSNAGNSAYITIRNPFDTPSEFAPVNVTFLDNAGGLAVLSDSRSVLDSIAGVATPSFDQAGLYFEIWSASTTQSYVINPLWQPIEPNGVLYLVLRLNSAPTFLTLMFRRAVSRNLVYEAGYTGIEGQDGNDDG